MTFSDFEKSLENNTPPTGIPILLEALWHDAKGDWEAAHTIAQSKEGTQAYDRLHAYLHRVEGDTWNATHWYRRASASMPKENLQEEWKSLVISLLG
jgi:hypothetical protein